MHSFLKNNVFSISFGTSLSKFAGCIRQIFIAAAFGVGVTYDAFNYAYIIPGFLLTTYSMNDRVIEFDPLIEGVLIKRYKRFLADIKLESGEVVTAHCANTGPMKGLLSEGAKVRISVSHSPKS